MTPRRYRRKPTEVDAVQWTGENFEEVRRFVGSEPALSHARGRVWAAYLDGATIELTLGDTFVREDVGPSLYSRAEFEATYEPVEDGRWCEPCQTSHPSDWFATGFPPRCPVLRRLVGIDAASGDSEGVEA